MRAPDGYVADVGPGSLVLVPQPVRHRLELPEGGAHVLGAATECRTDHGLRRLAAGTDDLRLLVVCGAVRVAYAGAFDVFGDLREPMAVELDDPLADQVFERMLAEQARMGPGSLALLGSLMMQCLVAVFRQLCETQECRLPWLAGLEDPRLGRALEAMLRAPGSGHSLESLASVAGMSRSSFADHFKRAFKSPPMEYLREIRLRTAAKRLRSTDDAVGAIAEAVGFSSRSHFSTAFRAAYRTDPATYRKRAGPDPWRRGTRTVAGN